MIDIPARQFEYFQEGRFQHPLRRVLYALSLDDGGRIVVDGARRIVHDGPEGPLLPNHPLLVRDEPEQLPGRPPLEERQREAAAEELGADLGEGAQEQLYRVVHLAVDVVLLHGRDRAADGLSALAVGYAGVGQIEPLAVDIAGGDRSRRAQAFARTQNGIRRLGGVRGSGRDRHSKNLAANLRIQVNRVR